MPPRLRFAAIADDFTGGTDLAGMLHQGGIDTVQLFGLPSTALLHDAAAHARAIVLSLKTRSLPAPDACQQSLAACRLLQTLAPRQLQFKYCSTFDSTPHGNIGPVTDALMTATGAPFTVAVPALPVNGRTQYLGHLFVNGRLLSESPLRHHPLNPMTDADLVRHLSRQTSRRVGLAPLHAVLAGPRALRAELARLQAQGVEIALVDAVTDHHLSVISRACRHLPLLTGGSGFGPHIGGGSRPPHAWNGAARPALLLAGSCSEATLAQLDHWEQSGGLVLRARDAAAIHAASEPARLALLRHGVVCVASSAPPAERTGEPPEHIEHAFAQLAHTAVHHWGVRTLIVAGGETSGAVVEAAGIRAGRVSGLLAPGVPGMISLAPTGLAFALKSGNFGGPHFFQQALASGAETL